MCTLWLGVLACMADTHATAAHPPVRAITVFLDLDAAHYEQQVIDAARGLHAAQARFEQCLHMPGLPQRKPTLAGGDDDVRRGHFFDGLKRYGHSLPVCNL